MARKRLSLNDNLDRVAKVEEILNNTSNDPFVEIVLDEDIPVTLQELSIHGSIGKDKTKEYKISEEKISTQEEKVLALFSKNAEQFETTWDEDLLSLDRDYTNTSTIELDKIRPNPDGSRKIIDMVSMEVLKSSIQTHGVIQPIIVRPLPPSNLGYSYEIVSGFRRYQASLELGLESIPCVVREINPDYSLVLGLVENLVRENLHPLEETFGILNLLQRVTKLDRAEVVSILMRLQREMVGAVPPISIKTQMGGAICKIFDILPITLSTFTLSRIQLLDVSDYILEAIVQNKIGPSIALMINNSIPDEEIKNDLAREVIENNLSRSKIRKRISEIKHLHFEQSSQVLKYQLKEEVAKLVGNKVWDGDDTRYISDLEKLLSKVKDLVVLHETRRAKKRISKK